MLRLNQKQYFTNLPKFVSAMKHGVLSSVMLLSASLVSCSDDYRYDDTTPDFLGESIYEYLEQDGNFSNYLRLVDDFGYKQVLSLTGSKTVFPANDEAFARFFQNNDYGVSSYEGLSYAQKRSLLLSSMVNMAYLTNMLSNADLSSSTQNAEGTAIRRASSFTYLDSITRLNDATQLEAEHWQKYADGGLYVVDDDTAPYITHFTPQHTQTNNIPESDFAFILGGDYQASDVYVNGVKVDAANITCKNGYVHVMHDVLTPQKNMSQLIADNEETSLFSRLMNRFSAPYYSADVTRAVQQLYTGSSANYPLIQDSIFVKRYFTSDRSQDPDGKEQQTLSFDPSNNNYSGSMTDMGAMFVPTNDAMEEYINGSKGRYLKDAYGSWDDVPSDLVAMFVKNHQKLSFMSSLPSMWPSMNDDQSFAMHVDQADVERTLMGSNGVVYVTNKVYPPVDYQSVYGSVLANSHTEIMKWALMHDGNTNVRMKFYVYLRSMENMYNLLVPTDEALRNYRDPVAWAKGRSSREIWDFRYTDGENNPVSVDVYSVTDDGEKGTLKQTLTDQTIILNRLYDIIDRHIVVGEMDDDGNMSGYLNSGSVNYAQTKGGATISVAGSGDHVTFTGAGDMEQGKPRAQVTNDETSNLPQIYDADNGRTFFIDRILQDATNTVFVNMQQREAFSTFFDLLQGNSSVFSEFKDDSEIKDIFSLNVVGSTSGLGQVVSSFSNFQYTIFVPSNEAVAQAFIDDPDLHTWDEIAEENDQTRRQQWAIHLIRFLKYHFMDNSLFVGGTSVNGANYTTAARNSKGMFQTLTVTNSNSNMSITDAHGNVAHVLQQDGLYNVQSRDIIVNSSDYSEATQIVSSSTSVMHLIDHALMPDS